MSKQTFGHMTKKGFTMVEVMISLGVFSLVMIGALTLQRDSTQISRTLVSTTSLQEEMRNAAAIITDEVQRALYVFPPCGIKDSSANTFTLQTCPTSAFPTWYSTTATNISFTFSRFTLGASGVTKQRPDNSSTTWDVGLATAPMLAMIVAPRRPGQGACDGTGGSAEKAISCYQFVAYYPVRRSAVTATGSADKLDSDSDNNNQWVLMEYRENLDDIIPSRSNTVTGISPFTTPTVRWDEVGCDSPLYSCELGSPPRPDPDSTAQKLNSALPALSRSGADAVTIASFVSRMYDTRTQINGNGGASANILMVGILPGTGFALEYPAASIDSRGATEVRIRLQAQIFRGGTEFRVPRDKPLEIYASPRNLPPSN
ncbi:MAG: hypothetical protein RLZZ156_39 [Deinococcota bacterium]